jgi:hypothetical protein
VTGFRRGGIRWQLALLVGVALVPFAVVGVAHVIDERDGALEDAERRSSELVQLVASRLGQYADRMTTALTVASDQLRLDPRAAAANDAVLRRVDSVVLGDAGVVNVRGRDDRNLGSALGPIARDAPVRVADRRYFREAFATGRPAIGLPTRNRADTTEWIFAVAVPFRDAANQEGLVYAAVRTDALFPIVEIPSLPATSTVTVLDTAGYLVYRTLGAEQAPDRDVRALPNTRQSLAVERGVGRRRGSLDGIERIAAWQRVPGTPWVAIVGIPTAPLLAEAQRTAVVQLGALAVALLLALGAAYRVAQGVAGPLQTLAADTRAFADGDLARRTTVRGSREIVDVATAFNAMADTLEDRTRSLEERERSFRLLFDENPLPMWVWDVETRRFLAVNQSAIRRYGWTRDEFLTMRLEDIRPPEEIPRFEAYVSLLPDRPTDHSRWRHRWHDGTVRDVEVHSTPLVWDGRLARLVVVHDVTERLAAEREVAGAQERMRQSQKLEALGALAGGVAHDFNNLLTAIIGNADLARDALPERHEARESVDEIRHAADRAAQLTQRLLTVSRRQVTRPTALSLPHVLDEMRAILERTMGEHYDLVIRVDVDVPAVHADRSQLEQVLLNLVVNARDAMPDGGEVRVSVGVAEVGDEAGGIPPAGRWVQLAVADDGVGIPDDVRPRIFDPFFTTKPRGKGTGLGLSIVYGIVKQADGYIDVVAAPGRGATFRVFLPPSAESPRPTPPDGSPVLQGGGETVLVVEDDAAVRRVTEQILVGAGYRVLAAASGLAAMDILLAEREGVQLLLTDVVMPGMNGRVLAERAQALLPGLRVLYASGYDDDLVAAHGVLPPDVAFVQKPFSTEALLTRVRAVLDGQASRSAG